jgi:hypothetical protein
MCYNSSLKSAWFLHARPNMDARHAVLLTPSKSSRSTQLLFYKQNASVSPLFATLTSSSYCSHSIAFSRPLFSYSYELFCIPQIHNSFVFFQFQTPSQKHRGYTLSSHSPLLSKRSTLHALLHFFAPFSFSDPLFSIVCALFCTFGGGEGPHLTVGKLRGKMETHKTPRTPRQGQDR